MLPIIYIRRFNRIRFCFDAFKTHKRASGDNACNLSKSRNLTDHPFPQFFIFVRTELITTDEITGEHENV